MKAGAFCTEKNHSRGPWRVLAKLTASENHKGYRIIKDGADAWWLADVSPVDEDGKEGGANAKLMAAAPDLLEALKALSAMYTHAWDMANGDLLMMKGSIPRFEAAHENALLAIEKATGK